MRLSTAIMAHIARAQQALDLAEQLDAAIALDHGDRGETVNGDIAWAQHDQAADWHIVLQDDAIPIDNFLTHAKAALEHAPNTAVSFYVGTGRPLAHDVTTATKRATTEGHAWLTHKHLLWGVAVAMPTHCIPDFLAWAITDNHAYDYRIGRYWANQKIPVRYTWPSLVDHSDGPTLLEHPWGKPKAPRHAHQVGTPTHWNTEATPI